MVREYTSQPCTSVPNQCCELGGSSETLRSQLCGLIEVYSRGKIAITKNARTSAAAAQNSTRRRRSRQASPARLRGLPKLTSSGRMAVPLPPVLPWPSDVTMASMSLIADPRVQDCVQDVDDQAGDQIDDHQDADDGHHRRPVLEQDPLVEPEADAGDVEDLLGDHGA